VGYRGYSWKAPRGVRGAASILFWTAGAQIYAATVPSSRIVMPKCPIGATLISLETIPLGTPTSLHRSWHTGKIHRWG
jgi:hypothetical protein